VIAELLEAERDMLPDMWFDCDEDDSKTSG